MDINYRVETRVAAHSPWRFTGIIESDKALAVKVWTEITRKLRHHAFRLIPITYGIPINRDKERAGG